MTCKLPHYRLEVFSVHIIQVTLLINPVELQGLCVSAKTRTHTVNTANELATVRCVCAVVSGLLQFVCVKLIIRN